MTRRQQNHSASTTDAMTNAPISHSSSPNVLSTAPGHTHHHKIRSISPSPHSVSTSAAARFTRRRPDRHPFVVDVPGSLFFSTRAMPLPNTRYSVVVGESFWRLAVYIDSVPSRIEERIRSKPPHILIRGLPGSGKSFLLAAASALLGFGPASLRPEEFSQNYLSADYRTIYIGDCKKWLESDDPLTYFRMELLRGLRDASAPTEAADHKSPDHLGCLMCVEPFTRLDQVRQFMDQCCRWIREYAPETQLIFFIDQAEELIGRNCSLPYQIIQILLAIQLPILIFSVSCNFSQPIETEFPFVCGTTISIPYRTNTEEFNKFMELYSVNEKTLGKETMMHREFRLWTGSVPVELNDLFKLPSAPATTRLAHYRKNVFNRVHSVISASANKLDAKQRNVLLIVLFAIVLRVPMDMSGEFNLTNILSLGPKITNLILLNCLQSFYHSTDGIITLTDVPAAISPSVHLALTCPSTLALVVKNWATLFENVVQAMMSSRLLCVEAKRRMSRFYTHAKFLWSSKPNMNSNDEWWHFEGMTEYSESVHFKFKNPRVVIFAGQVPPPSYFTDSNEHYGSYNSTSTNDAVVFLPGRASYWFFDLFIYVPEDRRLYALTSSGVVGTWLKDLSTRYGPLQLAQQKDEGILQPVILLDQWRDVLRRAGLTKVLIKCCVMKALDLMSACGYQDSNSGIASEGPVTSSLSTSPSPTSSSLQTPLSASHSPEEINRLAKHLEASVVLHGHNNHRNHNHNHDKCEE